MLTLQARAKINWTLDILERRDDGYHRMDMLMTSVELADELTLEFSDELNLRVAGNENLSGEENLVLQAARALKEETSCTMGANFWLEKHVPVGAGMGGGSADAAAALLGLNRLWETGLSLEQLRAVALRVGADVPFLLRGGLARVGGIGETIEPLPAQPSVPLVLIQPCKALSTREVFQAYDSLSNVSHPNTEEAMTALLKVDLGRLSIFGGNVLQQAAEIGRPQIAEAVAALDACGAAYACMTGSGSAVFGAFHDEGDAREAFRTLGRRWRKCWKPPRGKKSPRPPWRPGWNAPKRRSTATLLARRKCSRA